MQLEGVKKNPHLKVTTVPNIRFQNTIFLGSSAQDRIQTQRQNERLYSERPDFVKLRRSDRYKAQIKFSVFALRHLLENTDTHTHYKGRTRLRIKAYDRRSQGLLLCSLRALFRKKKGEGISTTTVCGLTKESSSSPKRVDHAELTAFASCVHLVYETRRRASSRSTQTQDLTPRIIRHHLKSQSKFSRSMRDKRKSKFTLVEVEGGLLCPPGPSNYFKRPLCQASRIQQAICSSSGPMASPRVFVHDRR